MQIIIETCDYVNKDKFRINFIHLSENVRNILNVSRENHMHFIRKNVRYYFTQMYPKQLTTLKTELILS